jgi:hypothetical protein
MTRFVCAVSACIALALLALLATPAQAQVKLTPRAASDLYIFSIHCGEIAPEPLERLHQDIPATKAEDLIGAASNRLRRFGKSAWCSAMHKTYKQYVWAGPRPWLPEAFQGVWCEWENPPAGDTLHLDELEDGKGCASPLLHHQITASELIAHEESCKIIAVKPHVWPGPHDPDGRAWASDLDVTMRCKGSGGERPTTVVTLRQGGGRSLYITEVSRKGHGR